MFWRGGEVAPFGEWLWEWLSLHLLHWYVIVLCAFFNTGKSEGTNLKMCVWWLCMYVLLYSVGIDFVDLTGGRCTDMRSFDVCICLWQEFDCPEVTLCCWQDVTILVDTSVIRMILLVGYHPEILLHYSKVICVVFQRVLSVARWRQSCNPRFYQSWKSWPLVPATSSNWEWATATSSSHTSAGCTCHTCRLNLPHLSRLNLSHLQAEPATHQPVPLWHWHPDSRICRPGLPGWLRCQTSKLLARGNGGTGAAVGTDSSTEKDCRLCFWCWTDYLSMTHQNAEVQHAWIHMAPPPI